MPKLVIDEALCKGCALCTIACPHQLIRLSTMTNSQGIPPAEISAEGLERCTSCALCARVCPDAAIEVWREKKAGTSAEVPT